MQAFKNIVVATDFGELADNATLYALDLALKIDARVTLFHAYQMPVYAFPDGASVAADEVASALSTNADSAMGRLVEKHTPAGVTIGGTVRVGSPAEEVQRFADEIDADLIVVGTHGRRGLARALLGSVAEIIVRTSGRPVLVVPAPAAA